MFDPQLSRENLAEVFGDAETAKVFPYPGTAEYANLSLGEQIEAELYWQDKSAS
ncbi:MAG: hypothetical protein AAB759_02010 [Patescibacteria group bacterium]